MIKKISITKVKRVYISEFKKWKIIQFFYLVEIYYFFLMSVQNDFTEQNLIDMKIHRMKSINNDSTLRFYSYPSIDIPVSLSICNESNFPINKLMVLGSFLSNVLVKSASETEIPCNQLSANILIDCGSTLNDENRMFNMMLICGLTQALDSFGIPYSVAVVADQNYLCQIKKFEEIHSFSCL